MDACAEARCRCCAICSTTMLAQAESLEQATCMPAYTHLQRAQPVSRRALDALALLAARARSRTARRTGRAAAVLPLGSGADRRLRLPQSRACCSKEPSASPQLSPNSIDAVGDRDFVAELLFALSMLGDPPLAARRGPHSLTARASSASCSSATRTHTGLEHDAAEAKSRRARARARHPAAACSAISSRCSPPSRDCRAATTRTCRTTSARCSTRSTRCCSCCPPSPARSARSPFARTE